MKKISFYSSIKRNWGIGMDIYDILEHKACDHNYKNRIIYYELNNNREYTYSDLFNCVNSYIKLFSNLDLAGKKKYLIVDNSVDSIALFIALLHCRAIVVLINKQELLFCGDNYSEYLKKIEKDDDYNKQLQILKYDYIIANDLSTFQCLKEEINAVTKYIDNIENNDTNENGDLFISTSGTTGKYKLVPLFQEELISKSLDSDQNYSILTTIPISSISGLSYGVFRPIIANVKNYLLISFR